MSARGADAMAAFDAATMPLQGIRLIEASAGTGKTFSLTGLYLRLIVERRLDVQDILVMTFTRAATQELRERLRATLARAARVAAEAPDPQRADAAERFAEDVIGRAGEERAAVARRLREAASRADQATITTIHGFAQRAAAENAFESALPFDRGEQIDDREIQREAATDYWRGRAFAADPVQARAFLALWASPEALHGELRDVLSKPHAKLLQPEFAAVERARQQALEHWPDHRDEFIACLQEVLDHGGLRKNEPLNVLLQQHGPEGLAEWIDLGLAGTPDGFPALPPVIADLCSDEGVNRHATNKACGWFRPQDLDGLRPLGQLQMNGRLAAAAHAVQAIHALAAERKRARREYSFDDMIAALHTAIEDPRRGPELARALRRTWPWALVDEFQDTDPLQYAILRRIYGREHGPGPVPDLPLTPSGGEGRDEGENDTHPGGLILIGDPKQAIYAFRGGDVFAYLDAADDADGRYGMATNHRSTPALVQGLDALFSAGGEQSFVIEDIRFLHVTAARQTGDRLVRSADGPVAGVTAWTLPADAGTAKGALRARIEAATIDRIAALLDDGQIVQADGDARPLAPGDIAVLVNTNRNAAEMQAALTDAGVPAVCIHQDSVFASEAAHDLSWLLQAVATPLDAERLRRALTTPLFGLTLGDLVRLDAEEAWPAWSERFQSAHVDWGRTGVQAMLEPFLQAAAGRVLTRPDGARRMTDYLHVAERLQEAEHEVFGREGLVRWLETAIEHSGEHEVAEADRVRLEDDSDLVQVTTVHKAKGLQWPVVFVPFAPWLGTGGPHKPSDPPLMFHDDDHRSVIDLGSSEAGDHCPRAVREHKAEQVRSLYVAFTRAEEALFFVHGAARQALDGPLAWVLHQDDGVVADQWHGSQKLPAWFNAERAHERLLALQKASDGALSVARLPEVEIPRRLTRAVEGELRPARSDFPPAPAPWSIFSFSRLAGRVSDSGEAVAGSNDEIDAPASPEPASPEPAPPEPTPPEPTPPEPAAPEPAAPQPDASTNDDATAVIAWPRGAAFGQAFHEIVQAADLGTWPAPGAVLDSRTERAIAAQLRRHGIATESAAGHAPIADTATLVAHTLHAPLPDIGPLARIPAERRRSELEFFLRLGGSSPDALLERIAAAGYGRAPRSAALPALRGLMHGYIDLVVEHGERYWIVDYKTNVLGPARGDYGPARLRQAMGAHHYDLQYLIYCVALHRHLRQSLADYDPETHLGGVLYLFVRGLDAGGERGVFADRPDPRLIVTLDALLDGREAAA